MYQNIGIIYILVDLVPKLQKLSRLKENTRLHAYYQDSSIRLVSTLDALQYLYYIGKFIRKDKLEFKLYKIITYLI